MTNNNIPHYDYIIVGSGAAGLSLLCYLLKEPATKYKQILLLDRSAKQSNDRTWCFWQKESSPFEEIVSMAWDQLYFQTKEMTKALQIAPYQYKMIKSLDFYQHCFKLIGRHENVTFEQTSISKVEDNLVYTTGQTYQAEYIFNSVFYDIKRNEDTLHFLQHFAGWYIETPTPNFDVDKPMLMDFNIEQKHDCSFVYVFPLSETVALVEYTLFSEQELTVEEYQIALKDYVQNVLKIEDYTIIEKEAGVIPMTGGFIAKRLSPHIINIGTAGGNSKPSTGYTFSFIQKYCAAIVNNLANKRDPLHKIERHFSKFLLYDLILLRVLQRKQVLAWEVFQCLFEKLPANLVLRFLDEETNLWEDIRVMNSVQKWPFIKAAFHEVTQLVTKRSVLQQQPS